MSTHCQATSTKHHPETNPQLVVRFLNRCCTDGKLLIYSDWRIFTSSNWLRITRGSCKISRIYNKAICVNTNIYSSVKICLKEKLKVTFIAVRLQRQLCLAQLSVGTNTLIGRGFSHSEEETTTCVILWACMHPLKSPKQTQRRGDARMKLCPMNY